jgi:hypothetical protein
MTRQERLEAGLEAHIKEYYPAVADLRDDLRAARRPGDGVSYIDPAQRMVGGGCFLTRPWEVAAFMRSIGGDKRLGDEKNWELYVLYLSRKIADMVLSHEEEQWGRRMLGGAAQ